MLTITIFLCATFLPSSSPVAVVWLQSTSEKPQHEGCQNVSKVSSLLCLMAQDYGYFCFWIDDAYD